MALKQTGFTVRFQVDGGDVVETSTQGAESLLDAMTREIEARLGIKVDHMVHVSYSERKALYSAKLASGKAYDVVVLTQGDR